MLYPPMRVRRSPFPAEARARESNETVTTTRLRHKRLIQRILCRFIGATCQIREDADANSRGKHEFSCIQATRSFACPRASRSGNETNIRETTNRESKENSDCEKSHDVCFGSFGGDVGKRMRPTRCNRGAAQDSKRAEWSGVRDRSILLQLLGQPRRRRDLLFRRETCVSRTSLSRFARALENG